MKITLLTLLFSLSSFAATMSDQEKAVLEAAPLNADRCLELNEGECKKEREELYRRGCVSKLGLSLLESKVGPLGQKGGYPLCTVDNKLRKWCYCGCFHPDTRILVLDKIMGRMRHVRARNIVNQITRYNLVVLDDNAKKNDIVMVSVPIEKVTRGPEKPALVNLHLDTGRELKVSSQHAIMLADGRMVVAEDVQEGQKLVGIDSREVTVKKIIREKTNEEVINFLTAGESLHGHMILAEGVVVGDFAYQNDLVPILNQEIL